MRTKGVETLWGCANCRRPCLNLAVISVDPVSQHAAVELRFIYLEFIALCINIKLQATSKHPSRSSTLLSCAEYFKRERAIPTLYVLMYASSLCLCLAMTCMRVCMGG